ncbi:MAG: peptide-methionine (S)-S-oxide reductase MsrA [Bacteroidia bacterium]|nr:peptide-methionine (S)-S-oxide reductase MsrA [Bacteroidia bacterium]MDW8235645.1 peptide-methionine (S)-S-oxide reductase MsrA [Bacteroidia bacterium]
MQAQTLEEATFGGGCFWCTEALFLMLKGVEAVFPGYAGGHVPNPSYEQVCTKTTGHAEVIRVRFRPEIISYEQLVEYFFLTHDPTTPNRQGNDVGPQYRSVIFYHSPAQKEIAEKVKQRLDQAGIFPAPIVTAIEPLKNFYRAEAYHHNYYALHPEQPYCRFVISPKLEKARQRFSSLLRQEKR